MPRYTYVLATLEYPPFHGGVATYLEELVVSRSHTDTTHVLHLQPEKDFFSHLWPRWCKCVGKVAREVRAQHPDFLEISHVLPMGYVAYIVKLVTGVPYIVYVHGLDVQTVLRSRQWWKRRAMAHILRNAYKVVCNSEFTRALVERGVGSTRVNSEVRYPRIRKRTSEQLDVAREHAETVRQQLGVYNKKVILSVGRLIERKGFATMVRALALLPEEYIYCAVGEGPELNSLRALAETLSVTRRAHFIGSVPDVYPYMALADVMVLPCTQLDNGDVEGFGMVLLEADQFSVPVIVGNSGGAPEAARQVSRGVVIEPGNEYELARAVIDICI